MNERGVLEGTRLGSLIRYRGGTGERGRAKRCLSEDLGSEEDTVCGKK